MVRRSAVAVALAAMLLANVAAAQPSADEIAAARALLRTADELRAKKDFAGALERYRKAHDVVRSPVTGLELARAHVDVGQLVAARATALSVVDMPVSASETEVGKNARSACATLVKELDARTPSVTVHVTGADAATATITLDGAALRETTDRPQRVDPGHHVIVAETQSAHARADIDVREGETKDVSLALVSSVAPPPPPSSGGSQRTIGIIVGAAGLVSIGVGSYFGLAAISKNDDSMTTCNGNLCGPEGFTQREDAVSLATLSTIFFAVGAAAVATGSVLWLTAPTAARPTASGLVVRF